VEGSIGVQPGRRSLAEAEVGSGERRALTAAVVSGLGTTGDG